MRLGWLAALCLALVGCGADGPLVATLEPSAAVTAGTDEAGPSAGPSASASASAAAEGTAPPELAGTWRRSFEGAPLLLTLKGNGYTAQAAGGTGAGRIFVEGDRITFSDSSRCREGEGTYIWGFEDGRLRFTLVGEDPCGRVEFLLRATFGRVDP